MRRAATALAVLAALVPAGCGGRGDAAGTRITSDTLTIYTGLPLRGLRANDGRAVLRGEKLALRDAGGRAGRFGIGLIALDDTDPSTGVWSPGRVAANTREVVQNPTTIAYIGDLDSGATAVSLPITNELEVLQVSPLSSYTGLTRPADKGEPARYYPSGRRTFARLVPTGAQQARALASWVAGRGIRSVALAYDGLQEALGQGSELERALQAAGVQVVELSRIDPRDRPADARAAAADLTAARAAAVIFAGTSRRAGVALLRAVHGRDPGERLFATSTVLGRPLARRPGAVGRRLEVLSPLLPVARRTAAAQRVAARYQRLFGQPMPPAAVYGYEAMRGVLAAIARARGNGNDRRAVVRSYFASAPRTSVLGPYAIGPLGDVGPMPLGVFASRRGGLRLLRVLRPARG